MYVSHYIEPITERRLYLCHDRTGYYYSVHLKSAHRFTTRDAAQRATPVYNGNPTLSAGVTSITRERVRCSLGRATPIQFSLLCVLFFLAISGTVFLISTFVLTLLGGNS